MQTMTPTGSRTTSELPTFSSHWNVFASFAYIENVNVGEPAWMRVASFIGMPTSAAMVRPISSPRALRPSWIFCRKAPRSAAGVRDQPSNAARAACTAASASCASPAGMVAMTSSVDALCTAIVPAPCGATHAPSM